MGDSVEFEQIVTDRLILRQWEERDLPAWAALNADESVMEFFPGTMTQAASKSAMEGFAAKGAEAGYGFFAIEADGECVGMAGLVDVRFEAPFTPAVEIGWRLAREHWGKGYASEAARGWLRFGFERIGCDEIVSFTAIGNTKSRAVMERIGLTHDEPGDFDHPNLPADHRLSRHALYRLSAADWRAIQ